MKVDNYQSWAKDLFGGTCYAACISYTSGKDDPIDITNMSEKEALKYYRDVLATWYYIMMEK